MRIVVAPDAFKGSLSAMQAAEAMAAGVREVMPDADIDLLPLADGGEGTGPVLASYLKHEESHINIDKCLVFVDEDCEDSALIESARCLGLTLPSMLALDVWQRGSTALGGLMCACLDAGVRRLVIALGGSATNDAGLGMLMSLGLRAVDDRGRAVSPDLHGLTRMVSLDASGMDARLAEAALTILCDVDAPLCGPGGAAFTFGPQKGLPGNALAGVDEAMGRFASLAEEAFGIPARDRQGSGAAGGLGFALALLGGRLVSGAAYVMERAGLGARLEDVHWVLTGEGRSDAQTLAGKLPLKLAEAAHAAGAKVALIPGDAADVPMLSRYFDAVVPARPDDMPLRAAMEEGSVLLARAACRWAAAMDSHRLGGRRDD